MSYSHSFAADFYGDVYNASPEDRPTNVADAIASIDDKTWESLAHDVFGCDPQFLTLEAVYEKIIETDTVSDLSSPVSVWIDEEGYYTVDVYDEED